MHWNIWPWIEAPNLDSSTARLTCLPFSSFVIEGSLWQARQSAFVNFGAAAFFCANPVAPRASTSITIDHTVNRFTSSLVATVQPPTAPIARYRFLLL